jgi:hypothetical protein
LSDQIFYAAAQDRDDDSKIHGYVPSKFLMRNGAYVVDPIPGASQNAYLYSDGSGSNKTNGKMANPNNYIVVPANHSEQEARDFAAALATVSKIGVGPTLALMTSAFWPGGSQELQRNPRWRIPPNSFVPAYKSAASDHFGYITGAAGLPRELAEIGGGAHNLYSWAIGKVSNLINDAQSSHPIEVSGKDGLSRINEANIAQGHAAGRAAGKPPSPFNDYGYGAQSQPTAGQIGDGNGISPFSAALAGINPDEPAPPAWPPAVDKPIRYLGRVAQ